MDDQELSELLRKLDGSLERLTEHIDKRESKPKDSWDKFDLLTKFIASVLLVAIGGAFVFLYNSVQTMKDQALASQHQKTYELETVSKFMPFLFHENEETQQTAVLVVQELIGTEMATRLALIKITRDTPVTLKRLSERDQSASSQVAATALQGLVGTGDFTVVSTLYVTDRDVTTGLRFGVGHGELSYGSTTVSMPLGHRMGELESPSIFRGEFRKDPTKHLVVLGRSPMDRAGFRAAIAHRLSKAEAKEVLVFVHGYNVGFDDAALRFSQLVHDLSFEGVPVLYSWPSRGSVNSYLVDQANAHASAQNLLVFLKDLKPAVGAAGVSIVAHGLGCAPVLTVLEQLGRDLGANRSPVFSQVVLIAPDVDAKLFMTMAPLIVGIAERITVYASDKDSSLQAAAYLHGGARAGESGEQLIVVSGVDTIDVSDAGTSDFLGHSFYAGAETVLADLFYLLRGAPPADRPLLTMSEKDGAVYWKLR